jgi:hypothetical protein
MWLYDFLHQMRTPASGNLRRGNVEMLLHRTQSEPRSQRSYFFRNFHGFTSKVFRFSNLTRQKPQMNTSSKEKKK